MKNTLKLFLNHSILNFLLITWITYFIVYYCNGHFSHNVVTAPKKHSYVENILVGLVGPTGTHRSQGKGGRSACIWHAFAKAFIAFSTYLDFLFSLSSASCGTK